MFKEMKVKEYNYKTAKAENLEILGFHDTVVMITKEQAVKFASMLLSATENVNEDGNISLSLSMQEPIFKSKLPEFSITINGLSFISPKVHYAIVEGHEILSPVFEGDEN